MSNYTFETLSANEFENLVRDLLQEELDIRLESFKTGRDQGIDLRYAPDRDNSLVVQCKHYVRSGTNKLIYDLEKYEVPKVHKLSPKRYIVATSTGLNPSDKEKILQLFPACKATNDIYGPDDLNNLLLRHPTVEKNHYKLWLASVQVLETLLKSAVVNSTRLDLERIHKKLKYYVQNASFTKAKKILDEQHYCIIAGIPGIGKTTLAEALFVDHISQGYEAVRIYGNIKDGFEMFKDGAQQVFYFDDFLGTTSFDGNSFERNEDKQLLDFLHSVHGSSGEKKLILTSRDYILKQAEQSFESIRYADIKPHLCIINLQNYTRWNKAKILYNHLYFSELTSQQIKELLTDRKYLRIIDHPYYSPRVVEWMTQMRTRWNDSKDGYAEAFLKALDNPTDIWKHAFDRDISLPAKYILWVMASLPDSVEINDLERVFNLFQQYMANYHKHSIHSMDFHDGLEEIEGTFIKIEVLNQGIRVIRFHNPSIRDFLENYLSEHEVVIRTLARSAQFFSQLRWLWGKYEIRVLSQNQLKQINPSYRSPMLKHTDDLIEGLKRVLYLEDVSRYGRRSYSLAERIFVLHDMSRNHTDQRLSDLMSEAIQNLISSAVQGNEKSFELMKLAKSVNKTDHFPYVKEAFLTSLNSWSDFERYLIFKAHYNTQITTDDEERVQERLNILYPDKDLSYVDTLINTMEHYTDEEHANWNDEDHWFNNKDETKIRQTIDPNENIVDLFDSLSE